MTGVPGAVFVYELRCRDEPGGWRVWATSDNAREVAELVAQAAAHGLLEGRDFRTRAEFPHQPGGRR